VLSGNLTTCISNTVGSGDAPDVVVCVVEGLQAPQVILPCEPWLQVSAASTNRHTRPKEYMLVANDEQCCMISHELRSCPSGGLHVARETVMNSLSAGAYSGNTEEHMQSSNLAPEALLISIYITSPTLVMNAERLNV
jgi:hypothetical protein